MKTSRKKTVVIALVVAIAAIVSIGLAMAYSTSPEVTTSHPTDVNATKTKLVTPNDLYTEVNAVRKASGLNTFSRNVLLDKSSRLKCEDMRSGGYYEHANPKTGKEGYSYVDDVGLSYVGNGLSENLNQGIFIDSKDVVRGWMASKPHKDSILDPSFKEIGFAVCEVNGLTTVVQHKIDPVVPDSTRPVANNLTRKNGQAASNKCNHVAKVTADNLNKEIIDSINRLYEIESKSSDPAIRDNAAEFRENKLSSQKYKHNMTLVQIGCS